jgi:putative sigma-54 modulation protein
MPIRITARNKMEVKPEFKALILKKCDRLAKHIEKIESIEVIMQEEKFRFRVEILVHASHFNGAALTEDDDLGAAFDNSLKRVERQITKQAKKQVDRAKRAKLVRKTGYDE